MTGPGSNELTSALDISGMLARDTLSHVDNDRCGFSGTIIRKRTQTEIQLAGEKRLLEMVALGYPFADVLDALCRFVEEEVAGDCRCGVYLIDERSSKFQTFAAPRLPAAFNDSICALPMGREAGPCARAACTRMQVITADVESDPLWKASAFRQLAKAHGQRSCWSTPIFSSAGRVLGTFAILQGAPAFPTSYQQDLIVKVTQIASIAIERAQGDAALKRSEAFLLEAQRLSSTGSFSWRVATDELAWSDQLYRIFEFERSAPVTFARIDARVHPEDVALLRENRERARRHGLDIEQEYRLLMNDQSVKHLHMVARATLGRDGWLEYIGAVQDVTQRRMAEEALSKARSELSRVARVMSLGALTASIAHEVNQPLSAILTNAGTCLRMLAADPPDVGGAREIARRTLRDGRRAAEVITRLRALFDRKEPKVELVDLNEATREVIALSMGDLQRNRIFLRTELADDLPLVNGDRVQLQQVVLNLLTNASDAMAGVENRSRQLLVKTELEGGWDQVRLSVTDAGAGMEAPAMARLFEPFCSTKPHGMGIGLFVCRSIIENHDGCLQVAANQGPGVTFSFWLPRARRCRLWKPMDANSRNLMQQAP
jgi:signal transduction histidine kinase